MSYQFANYGPQPDRHKVFVSYYHNDDQGYRNAFEEHFGHLFISKSVAPGEIASDLSTEYIKQLIQEGYISDSSVVIVLVGPKTYGRKHVDWEISAGLNKKLRGYSGLMGILLPEFPLEQNGNYLYRNLPARLADNAQSGFASVYLWNWLCADKNRVKTEIHRAFESRVSKSELINNSCEQMGRNLCA